MGIQKDLIEREEEVGTRRRRGRKEEREGRRKSLNRTQFQLGKWRIKLVLGRQREDESGDAGSPRVGFLQGCETLGKVMLIPSPSFAEHR